MRKARMFLDALVGDGVLVTVSRDGVSFSGPETYVNAAYRVLRKTPSIEGDIIRLINPKDEEMRNWLDRQPDDVRQEHAARTKRLERAGISDAETVSLDTTFRDRNSNLPDRLKPKVVKG